MGTADRIRFSRVRAGKSAQQVASALGLNEAWYGDLESHDDELESTLSLFQATQLASLLGVRLQDLVAGDALPNAGSIGLVDLPSLIERHIAREGVSIEGFEDRVGWELRGFMQSPVAAAAELPIMFLRDLSEALDISWLSLLPEDDAH
jgi:transcriptional regulator with XRE-family HTH domain